MALPYGRLNLIMTPSVCGGAFGMLGVAVGILSIFLALGDVVSTPCCASVLRLIPEIS